jgi:Lrp/AsnC family leucine-responsive transcriptional regulator
MDLDDKSWTILSAVQRDGRISLKALAAEAGLSLPAVSERLRRLVEAGVILGFRAQVDPEALGHHVLAIIGITTPQNLKGKLLKLLEGRTEVLECLHVTGQDSYLLRVAARDIRHLEQFVSRINVYGETRSSIVMSTPIPLRPLERS